MDKNREIIHKILDGEASNDEKKFFAKSLETDTGLKEEFDGLENAVRMLGKSERREPPISFTTEVMKRLPRKKASVFTRIREFLFGSRVLHWNMATALGVAVVVLFGVITVSRVHLEPSMNAARPVENEVTVRLTFYAPQARTVSVAGDFNRWKTDADEMKGTNGMWHIDLKLKPGVYSYSFVVDGKSWVVDPGAQSYTDDGFGSHNAVLRVSI
jgi:anti-sigma factor RsiW